MALNFTPDTLIGTTVTDSDGDKIGKVDDVYLDNSSGEPEWVSVKTGLFGSNISLIPLAQATGSGDTLSVPFDKAKVKDAPHHDPGTELSEADETELYRYYEIPDTNASSNRDDLRDDRGDLRDDLSTAGTTTGAGTTLTDQDDPDDRLGAHGAGYDTFEPNTDDSMTRSKEELRVGTETREAGRARLRKYITSDHVSRSVPVSHEEVVVEREPITDANRGDALSGQDLSEEEHEVVLTEERAVAAKDTVPVERVRLGTETVQGTETVDAQVREEHIDLDTTAGQRSGASPRDDHH